MLKKIPVDPVRKLLIDANIWVPLLRLKNCSKRGKLYMAVEN